VEFEIITRWLLMHHVQVSSASYAGGWADFQQQILKGGTGIIIVRITHSVEQTNTKQSRHIPTLNTSQVSPDSAKSSVEECVSGRSGFNQVSNTTMLQMRHLCSGMIALRYFLLVDSSTSRTKSSKRCQAMRCVSSSSSWRKSRSSRNSQVHQLIGQRSSRTACSGVCVSVRN